MSKEQVRGVLTVKSLSPSYETKATEFQPKEKDAEKPSLASHHLELKSNSIVCPTVPSSSISHCNSPILLLQLPKSSLHFPDTRVLLPLSFLSSPSSALT